MCPYHTLTKQLSIHGDDVDLQDVSVIDREQPATKLLSLPRQLLVLLLPPHQSQDSQV